MDAEYIRKIAIKVHTKKELIKAEDLFFSVGAKWAGSTKERERYDSCELPSIIAIFEYDGKKNGIIFTCETDDYPSKFGLRLINAKELEQQLSFNF